MKLRNPTPRQATLVLFWDYDTQWAADRSRSGGGKKDWGGLDFENTERLLDLHAEYQIPGCFAVVGAAAMNGTRPYHDPAQIRRIHQAGHEVASHSYRHEWLPALSRDALVETLVRSRETLENCIGAPVRTFVPPYNQPFDYARRGSFSLSERRTAGRDRTSLSRLCRTLEETGYEFCRVSYKPGHLRLAEMILRRPLYGRGRIEMIGRMFCLRLNAPCGFAKGTTDALRRAVNSGGIAAIYAHPHSLTLPGLQNFALLVPFLKQVSEYVRRNQLRVLTPLQVVAEHTRNEGLRSFL